VSNVEGNAIACRVYRSISYTDLSIVFECKHGKKFCNILERTYTVNDLGGLWVR